MNIDQDSWSRVRVMTQRLLGVRALTTGLLFFTVVGCSSKNLGQPLSETEEHLYALGKAYIQASSQLNRGPKNFSEIKSFLAADAPGDLLRSPNDGEEFVILWGVDFNKLPPVGGDPYYVGAYEKTGKNGKRFVLRFPIGVVTITDEEFKAAKFPPGHKPPS
jgi:hypothetical protein